MLENSATRSKMGVMCCFFERDFSISEDVKQTERCSYQIALDIIC